MTNLLEFNFELKQNKSLPKLFKNPNNYEKIK